jgi:chaperonin GroES
MSEVRITPLDNNVLVSLIPPPDTTASGLYVGSQPSYPQGYVIAVGPGYRNDDGTYRPLAVQPGDLVLFKVPYGCSLIKANGKEYYLFSAHYIEAKLNQAII